MSKKTLLAGALGAAGLLSASPVHAGVGLTYQVWAQSDGTFWTGELLMEAIADASTGPFTTASIGSDDHRYDVHSDGSSRFTGHANFFPSLPDLVDSIPPSLTLTLDAGLATERTYTTTVNVGSLPSVVAPVVSYPANHSTVPTLHPTFQFTLSPDASIYRLTLGHFVPIGPGYATGVNDVGISIPSTTTTWTPSFELLSNTEYYFDLEANTSLPGFSFTTPTDANGNALGHFAGAGTLWLWRSLPFSTAIPEPVALPAAAGCGLLLRRRRRDVAA